MFRPGLERQDKSTVDCRWTRRSVGEIGISKRLMGLGVLRLDREFVLHPAHVLPLETQDLALSHPAFQSGHDATVEMGWRELHFSLFVYTS
jgi:hypothetical protein